MRTADLAGKFLHGWVSAALGQPPGTAYSKEWPAFDALLEREAIHLAPMPGKAYQWCAIVVGRIGDACPKDGEAGWKGPILESPWHEQLSRLGMVQRFLMKRSVDVPGRRLIGRASNWRRPIPMPDICSGRQGRTAAEGSQVSFHAYSGCPCCPKRNPQFSHSAFKFFCPSFCVASVACGDGQSFSSNRHACGVVRARRRWHARYASCIGQTPSFPTGCSYGQAGCPASTHRPLADAGRR
jgi:hypothetical protein